MINRRAAGRGIPRPYNGFFAPSRLCVFALSIFFAALLLAACNPAANPTPQGRDPATLTAPPTFQDVNQPITLANVQNIAYLGRLTQPETPGTLFSFALSPDGTRLVGVTDSQIFAWNVVNGDLLFSTSRQDVIQVYYSADKTEVYGVQSDGGVLVLSPETGVVEDTFVGIDSPSGITAFDSFNGWLAIGGSDGSFKVWDPLERISLVTIAAHNAPVSALAFSGDGEQVISAAGDERMMRLYLWRDRTLIAEREIGRANSLSSIAISPRGDYAAVSTDFNAVLWSLSDPSQVTALDTGQGGANQLLRFSPDGRFLVAGNRVNGLMLWDIQGGVLAARLPDTASARVSIAFSPDAPIMLSSSLDKGVSLWNLSNVTAQSVDQAALQVGTTRIHSIAWTDDGRLLLMFDAGGAVYLWGIPQAA